MKYLVLCTLYVLVFSMNNQAMELHKTQRTTKRQLRGEMPLTDENNFQYYGKFSLGTPAQALNLVMDTTEDQTWVSPAFISANSTSANISKTQGNLTYGGGYVLGYYGTDVISQTELFLSGVNINLLFGLSCVNLPSFDQNGIIGLTNNQNYKNFVEQAAAAKQLNDSVFAFNVNNMYSTSEFFAGTASFPSRLSLAWINCTSSQVWQIPISAINVNNQTFPLTQSNAIIDTSLSLIVIPQEPFNNFVLQLSTLCQKQANYYICDCVSLNNFPILYFVSGNNTMQVGPKQYLDPLGTGEFCFLGIYPTPNSIITLGDSFLRNYFIAFDKVNNRIAYSTFQIIFYIIIVISPNKPN